MKVIAEQSFPQIPSTVWWGVRALLQRTPRAKFDDQMLAAELGVQPVAAKQYFVELRRVGILDDDGRGTELASRWRMAESYVEAVKEIAQRVYPEGLVTIAPPGAAERQKVVNWFMNQGLGEGSAKNKAATYLLITNDEPGASPSSTPRSAAPKSTGKKEPATKSATTSSRPKVSPKAISSANRTQNAENGDSNIMPLNVNVQIHISADASSEQIESIFLAMKKYLRND